MLRCSMAVVFRISCHNDQIIFTINRNALGTVHLIFRGGGLGFFVRAKIFFFGQNRSKIIFFAGPLGRIIFFFITERYIYNIYAFATTLCLIQAFATTSCFRDNLILKFKAFALYSHSIQVFATTTDCSSRNKHTAS